MWPSVRVCQFFHSLQCFSALLPQLPAHHTPSLLAHRSFHSVSAPQLAHHSLLATAYVWLNSYLSPALTIDIILIEAQPHPSTLIKRQCQFNPPATSKCAHWMHCPCILHIDLATRVCTFCYLYLSFVLSCISSPEGCPEILRFNLSGFLLVSSGLQAGSHLSLDLLWSPLDSVLVTSTLSLSGLCYYPSLCSLACWTPLDFAGLPQTLLDFCTWCPCPQRGPDTE